MNWLEQANAGSLESENRFRLIKIQMIDSILERQNLRRISLKSIEIIRNSQNEIIDLKFNFEDSKTETDS